MITSSPLTLIPEHLNATITISIFDDDFLEPNESFRINLSLRETVPALKLNPSAATVVILDNDGGCCLH